MPRIQRRVKFQLCLTPTEKQLLQQKANDINISVSELLRLSALKQKPQKPLSQINAQTYWELGQIATHLTQMSYTLNLNQPMDRELLEIKSTLNSLSQLLNQIRQELIKN